jgi:hypothetical protein
MSFAVRSATLAALQLSGWPRGCSKAPRHKGYIRCARCFREYPLRPLTPGFVEVDPG